MFRVQFTDPMLISESGSDSAVALESVTLLRDPFPVHEYSQLQPGSTNAAHVVWDEHGSDGGGK